MCGVGGVVGVGVRCADAEVSQIKASLKQGLPVSPGVLGWGLLLGRFL